MLLDGMRVISFCRYLHGPAATQCLADMGADVIKFEPYVEPARPDKPRPSAPCERVQ